MADNVYIGLKCFQNIWENVSMRYRNGAIDVLHLIMRLEVRVRTPKSQLLLAQSAKGYKFVIWRGVEISFND